MCHFRPWGGSFYVCWLCFLFIFFKFKLAVESRIFITNSPVSRLAPFDVSESHVCVCVLAPTSSSSHFLRLHPKNISHQKKNGEQTCLYVHHSSPQSRDAPQFSRIIFECVLLSFPSIFSSLASIIALLFKLASLGRCFLHQVFFFTSSYSL